MPRYKFLTDQQTAKRMRGIRTSNTNAELVVRRTLFRLGFRYRLKNDLPGKPDVVLSRRKIALFVNGCFWHGHCDCKKGMRRPRRNSAYWEDKIKYNIEKDIRVKRQLDELGWCVVTIWECQLKDQARLESQLTNEIRNAR